MKLGWAGLENIFDFSVESDFADGRYPEYRRPASVLRDRLFGTAGEPQPRFDGSIRRMNSESPFRISSMVLAVACVLCGASASPYFLALSSTHMSADEQLSVAADMLRVEPFRVSNERANEELASLPVIEF